MAIASAHYQLLCQIRHLLPRAGSLLEIGEANWYGDIAPHRMYDLIEGFDGFNWDESPLAAQTREAIESKNGFAICKAMYGILFSPSRLVAVDLHGPDALKQDLNAPLDLGGEKFDVVYNHGTAEHIFNIAQVFRSMHEHCEPGGLMIHESPCTGWLDHGFYCLQPTLFYDVAAANRYEIVFVALETLAIEVEAAKIIRLNDRDHATRLALAGELPANAMLFVVLRKLGESPFQIPCQGYYSQTLSPHAREAWRMLR